MTTQPPLPYSGPQPEITPPPAPRGKNVVGTIALVAAIAGFVFACIPGALIVGWILLPIAFVLSIVGLVLKDKTRTSSIAALILSIVGTIVGVIVFLAVVGNAVDDALSNDVTVQTPISDDPAETAPDGTRANPFPLGSELRGDEWNVVINAVDLDATEAVLAENEFNDPPEEGNVYILVNVTSTYTGTDPDGSMPWVTISYVNSGGNTFDVLTFDTFAVAPDPFDSLTTLYEGASTSGNHLLQVPADGVADGVLAVSIDMFSDKVFVALQ